MIGIKERRTAAGMSRRALAEASGVSPKTIQRAETDASYMPSLRSTAAIADALGTTVNDLIHEDDSATPATAGVKNRRGPSSAKTRAASTTKGA